MRVSHPLDLTSRSQPKPSTTGEVSRARQPRTVDPKTEATCFRNHEGNRSGSSDATRLWIKARVGWNIPKSLAKIRCAAKLSSSSGSLIPSN
jgi:hypothetical protein